MNSVMNTKMDKKNRAFIGFVLIMVLFCFAGPREAFSGEKPVTVSALGDCILVYKVSNYDHPGFKKIIDVIRGTDCTVGNCEVAICKASIYF